MTILHKAYEIGTQRLSVFLNKTNGVVCDLLNAILLTCKIAKESECNAKTKWVSNSLYDVAAYWFLN